MIMRLRYTDNLESKWEDCRLLKEQHEFYLASYNTAKCDKCKQVLFLQKIWVYADDGLEYQGIVNP